MISHEDALKLELGTMLSFGTPGLYEVAEVKQNEEGSVIISAYRSSDGALVSISEGDLTTAYLAGKRLRAEPNDRDEVEPEG